MRRWTVVTAARSPQHHRDGRRCTGRSATAIRCFPGAVLPPSRKGCCWRGNNGGRGWAALARVFGRGGDGAIGGGRSHGHRPTRWRRIERHRAIMEAWRSEACRIRESWERYFFWRSADSGGIRTKSIKEAREHVHITGEVVPQPTDRSADR